jgi:hypothetical protein
MGVRKSSCCVLLGTKEEVIHGKHRPHLSSQDDLPYFVQEGSAISVLMALLRYGTFSYVTLCLYLQYMIYIFCLPSTSFCVAILHVSVSSSSRTRLLLHFQSGSILRPLDKGGSILSVLVQLQVTLLQLHHLLRSWSLQNFMPFVVLLLQETVTAA